jgi:hypothetical protein
MGRWWCENLAPNGKAVPVMWVQSSASIVEQSLM